MTSFSAAVLRCYARFDCDRDDGNDGYQQAKFVDK
jgi:hypothetical protein